MEQSGGAAGRWSGQGFVYHMTCTGNRTRYHKIGCSIHPAERLDQIRRQEQNPNITLHNSVWTNDMNGAETAAQNAFVAQMGAVKDPSRGGATDWYIKRRRPEHIWPVIYQTVQNYNC